VEGGRTAAGACRSSCAVVGTPSSHWGVSVSSACWPYRHSRLLTYSSDKKSQYTIDFLNRWTLGRSCTALDKRWLQVV